MKASFGVVFGWCGFGVEGGLFPNVRLGLLHFWCCRGSIFDRISALHVALADAARELRKPN